MDTPLPRIVVCDDSATIRQVIGALLRPKHQVIELDSGEAALAEAERHPPDLIISDIEMGGIDGYQLCAELKRRPGLTRVPVVLLTSRVDEESKVAGLEAGADEYLFKPVRPRELLARVASLLRLRAATQELERRSQQLQDSNQQLQQAQSSLVAAEKMAAIGTLVAGVAHELNNPLAYVRAGLNFITNEVKELSNLPPDTREDLLSAAGDSLEGVVRIGEIVKGLEATARVSPEQPEDVTLDAEVHAAWLQVNNRAHAQLSFPDGEPFQFHTGRSRLGQVLRAVLANAAEATRGKGKGHIQISGRHEGMMNRISVHDDGVGIAPEHLSRVFDPFFTTKPPGQGTGLGLSVAQGLVRSLGGTITIVSKPGEGATVQISLPERPVSDYPRDNEVAAR